MTLGGYAHHVGRINLSTGQVTYEDIPEEWARKYIGGRGLGVRYCLEAGPTVDPLSLDNLLCYLSNMLKVSHNFSRVGSMQSYVTRTGQISQPKMCGDNVSYGFSLKLNDCLVDRFIVSIMHQFMSYFMDDSFCARVWRYIYRSTVLRSQPYPGE